MCIHQGTPLRKEMIIAKSANCFRSFTSSSRKTVDLSYCKFSGLDAEKISVIHSHERCIMLISKIDVISQVINRPRHSLSIGNKT